jgi:hypothetical protein
MAISEATANQFRVEQDTVGGRAAGRRVTDTMILAAARALSENSPPLLAPSASRLPALADLRKVAVHPVATQWTPAYPSFAPSER